VFCDESYSASPHDLAYNCNSQPLNIKKNKINKDNFEKIIKKKTMWRDTIAIHSVL
jgi:hypothetical protein